jgi:hypothetical protein
MSRPRARKLDDAGLADRGAQRRQVGEVVAGRGVDRLHDDGVVLQPLDFAAVAAIAQETGQEEREHAWGDHGEQGRSDLWRSRGERVALRCQNRSVKRVPD